MQFLIDKGWGDMDTPVNAEAILTREREKTWELMRELVDDMSVFDVLTYSNLFHNLKAAIKEVATEEKNPNIFFNDCAISGEEMMEIISEKNFSKLPESMSRVAEEAYETFLHTRDGQLCDIMVDKAALEAIYEAVNGLMLRLSVTMQSLRWLWQISKLQCVHKKPRKQWNL